MTIVDTHQHFWNFERFPYSWCRNIPALDRSFVFNDYLEAAQQIGITRTVFVECDVDEPFQLAEAAHVQTLADEYQLIAGIVAACRPEQNDFEAQLEQLKGLSKVRGLRRVLHAMPDEISQSPLFAENLRRLTDYQWSFDLCVQARQLPLAINLVERCPEVSFILDHCGVPDVKGKACDPWRAHIAELARHPNVVCKISGLVAYADPETWTESDLRPWVEHAIEHFGWDRVLWGSDWPVCTLASMMDRWLRTAQSLVSHATVEEKEKFFGRNAERIYRLN